jgi:hypothetical protein
MVTAVFKPTPISYEAFVVAPLSYHAEICFLQEKNKEIRDKDGESHFLTELDEWTDKLTRKIEVFQKKESAVPLEVSILDDLSLEMQKLDAYFVEKSPTLTAYDMKRVQNAVLDIRAKFSQLQDIIKPKKKFGFKGIKKRENLQPEPASPAAAEKNDAEKMKTKKDLEQKREDEHLGFMLENRCDETIHLTSEQVNLKLARDGGPIKFFFDYLINFHYCLTDLSVDSNDITALVSGEQKHYFHLWGLQKPLVAFATRDFFRPHS